MEERRLVEVLDLSRRLEGEGSGPLLSLESEDLDVNLVRFEGGAGVGTHVNREVDVLIVVVAGRGTLTADGADYPLAPGRALLVPKGASRAIRSADDGQLAYLTVHRRRKRLMPELRSLRDMAD